MNNKKKQTELNIEGFKPKVSIVIPAYNYGQFVGKAIQSVLDQSFRDIELIVMDNASTDNTQEVVKSFLHDKRLIYVHNGSNIGAEESTYKGIDKAKGEYLILLAADDYQLPGMLSLLVNELENHPDAGFAYGRYVRVNENDTVVDDFNHSGWDDFNHDERLDEIGRLLGRDCYISLITALFRRNLYDKYPLAKKYTLGDYEYFLNLSSKGVSSRFINVPLAAHRYHGNQMSNNPEIFRSGTHLEESLIFTESFISKGNSVAILGYEEEILNMLNIKIQMFINYGGKVTNEIEGRVLAIKATLQGLKEEVRPLSKVPLVSIVLVTQNNISFLRDALFSIKTQSYLNFEVIVINNGGRPAGPIVASVDLPTHYIELRQALSNGSARNIGVRFSKGEVICYLDDSDVFLEDHLQIIVDELKGTNAYFVCTKHGLASDDTNIEQNIILPVINPNTKSTRLIQCIAPISTWGHKKDLVYKLGQFDENNLLLDDLDYLFRVIGDYDIKKIPRVTVSSAYEKSQTQVIEVLAQEFRDAYKQINEKNAAKMDVLHQKLAQFSTVEEYGVYECSGSRADKCLGKIVKGRGAINILFVVHSFIPYSHAGVEVYTSNLASTLSEQGGNVAIFYPICTPGLVVPYVDIITENGIAQYQLHIGEFQAISFLDDVIEKLFLEVVTNQHFDVIHFQHIFKLPLSLLSIARKHTKNVLFTAHDHYLICPRINLIKSDGALCSGPSLNDCAKCLSMTEQSIEEWREGVQKALSCVDTLISPSKYLAERLQENIQKSVSVIPLGVQVIKTLSKAKHDRIIFIGSVVPFKGVHNLILAYIQATIEIPLEIWGGIFDEGYKKHLASLAQENKNIFLKGAYDREMLIDILSSARVVVVPSYRESYSLVVREALAAKIPVIASNVGGIPEVVKDGENGYLFEPDDVYYLANLLHKFSNSSFASEVSSNIGFVKSISDEACELLSQYMKNQPNREIVQKKSGIAVIVHLYCIELWEELKLSILSISHEYELYISIPENEEIDISKEILQEFPSAKIYKLENKGRDILPFLQIFKEIEPLGYKLILKLHSKKSSHLKGYKGIAEYGEKWREGALVSLLGGKKRVNDIFDLFDLTPELGLFSPADQLCTFKSTDINYQIVNQLLPGIDQETFDSENYSYAAGSMFWFRPEALKKILQLNLTEENFEDELGQLDGTLAHAVERLFGVICKGSGYTSTDRVSKNDDVVYQNWLSVKRSQGLQQSDLFLQTVNSSLQKIHCLIYVDNEDLSLLANTIDSMSAQNYENWHLSVISCFACPDELFNEVEQLSWLHISESTNLNVILHSLNVESEWVVFLEAGDVLEVHALSACIEYSLYYPDSKVIYTDEDTLTPDGYYYSPNFKPDFNLDLLYSTDYVGGLAFFRLTDPCEFGDVFFPSKFIAYDLIFRYLELFSESAIAHKDSVLLHRLKAVEEIKSQQVEFRAGLLTDYFKRSNIQATIDIEHDKGNLFIRYIHNEEPMVSIIIPTKDQLDILKACVNSILEKTSYINYEVIIVDNQSSEVETIDYFESLKGSKLIKVIEYDDVYNYSAINNYAISKSLGDYVVLLNNDTMVLQENWLQGMLNYAQCADVGVVGVKLVFPNKTLQHAGVILGMGGNGVAEHPYIGISMDDAGYMNRAMCVQSMSAVTAACLMLKKSTYLEVGGLDEEKFKILYNDIDLCLKVKSLGKRNVWTPYVTLIHHGSSSIKKLKVDEKKRIQTQYEVDSMVEKWLPQLASDPAYNKNLSLKTSDFQIDDSLNVTWGIDCKNKPRVYAFPLDSNGVGQYRVRGPLGALSEAGLIDVSLANNWDSLVFPTPVEIERIKPDVLLLQNGFLDHMLGPWKRYHRFNDVFKVCGLDDLVYMLPHKHPKQGLWPKNVRRKVQELFNHSDRVVVANNALAEEFSKMTSDIVVVPNYLETWRWRNLTQPENKIRKKLRVGWAGGCEHVSDLQFILPVVEALHKEVDWIFMGDISVELKSFVAESYSAVQFDFYPQKLADLDLDLAIAPLGHNKFNECKTNLRLLEYGILGWPVVCTDILPYQNAPVTRVANNVNEWIRVIKDKINEPVALKEEGEALQKWVIENYMLDDHIDEWVAALLP